MIKINLANSLIAKSGGKAASAVAFDPKQVAIKIALLVIPLIGFILFEKNSIEAKKIQLVEVQQKLAKLTKELDSVGSIDDIVRQVNEQKADLDGKMNVMRQIFGLRSQKIKSLFSMQANIPEKAWLTNIVFNEKTISVLGYASSVEEVQTFIYGLSLNADVFENVTTTSTVIEKINGKEFFKFDVLITLKD